MIHLGHLMHQTHPDISVHHCTSVKECHQCNVLRMTHLRGYSVKDQGWSGAVAGFQAIRQSTRCWSN